MNNKSRILAIGAHPDDCDIKAGGCAMLWARAGCTVKFVSVTNGESGHHQMSGQTLVARRTAEAQAAAKVAGIEYLVMDNPDGRLLPGLEERSKLMRVIREFRPDLILTHRPNDYHPDHRYTSQLVQDCSYLVGVPNVCPEVPYLEKAPVIAYFQDNFQKPIPFRADVAVDIDSVFAEKVRMLACHESQFFEWLPWIGAHGLDPSEDPKERLRILEAFARDLSQPDKDTRFTLEEWYGALNASKVQFMESFEACEYGSEMDPNAIRRLFPVPETW
ncbi:MAG: PIG-L family deacetylase [Verrucomicrobiae bacterium]|nr:PIG-L family deacetylase [Verrucomicrobiae bacterium]